MGSVGQPDEYEAWIVDSATQEPLVTLPWSSIRWQRVENDISAASVFIAEDDGGIECCGDIGGLETWSQMLRIERNGTRVWDGPILGWSRPALTQPNSPRGVTVRAQDRFVLTTKRLVGANIPAPLGAGEIQYLLTPARVFWQLLTDAGFGGGSDPYPFTVPALTEFLTTSDLVDREYKVDRMERVYDCISELASNDQVWWSMVGDTLYVNPVTARTLLGVSGDRPVLSDETVVGIPGIEVDGIGQISVAYGAAAGEGKNGFPVITTLLPFYGRYLNSLLEGGITVSRSQVDDPRGVPATDSLTVDTGAFAARNATPNFTIEQTALAPGFGNEALEDDLSNLIPGAVFDIDFESTCAFDVPFMGVEHVYRFWYSEPDPEGGAGAMRDVNAWMQTPVFSDTVASARLGQLDVTVTAGQGGITEEVLASLAPTADFTTLIAWIEPFPIPDVGPPAGEA